MSTELLIYSLFILIGTFISSIAQIMLKKASQKEYSSPIREYLNPLVIFAYFIFFVSTFFNIFAYKVVPLSWGPILESTSYIYITVFGVIFFKEKINKRKILALGLIIVGIVVYSL